MSSEVVDRAQLEAPPLLPGCLQMSDKAEIALIRCVLRGKLHYPSSSSNSSASSYSSSSDTASSPTHQSWPWGQSCAAR
eukprot:CAMPEP_0179168842 /NCGR_PEP_ID=MMETSP0796-20121207/83066_1 /TAXON_ID=73915 /ORGANISM="Pyrodinium bahamense, Strain pbaha01" /LENGTH=78 /DNA_ID=CAMNT_0020871621 /DNA_START=395 /DNA_END=627 /DNA_ORIENTATION=+